VLSVPAFFIFNSQWLKPLAIENEKELHSHHSRIHNNFKENDIINFHKK
jgi:hypothetical protein